MSNDTSTALNLAQTSAALVAYDIVDAGVTELLEADDLTDELVLKAFALLEEAGEAVGAAFGEDTSDRNSVETCRGVVRPGPAIPRSGSELSFVRRLVAEWRRRGHPENPGL